MEFWEKGKRTQTQSKWPRRLPFVRSAAQARGGGGFVVATVWCVLSERKSLAGALWAWKVIFVKQISLFKQKRLAPSGGSSSNILCAEFCKNDFSSQPSQSKSLAEPSRADQTKHLTMGWWRRTVQRFSEKPLVVINFLQKNLSATDKNSEGVLKISSSGAGSGSRPLWSPKFRVISHQWPAWRQLSSPSYLLGVYLWLWWLLFSEVTDLSRRQLSKTVIIIIENHHLLATNAGGRSIVIAEGCAIGLLEGRAEEKVVRRRLGLQWAQEAIKSERKLPEPSSGEQFLWQTTNDGCFR